MLRVPDLGEAHPLPSPDVAPRWVTAIGAWGDTLAAMGNAQHVLRQTGAAQCGILHYGWDPEIAAFLREQPCFSRVRQIQPKSAGDYRRIVEWACSASSEAPEWIREIAPEVSPREVWPTHVYLNPRVRLRCHYPEDVRLPYPARWWAADWHEARLNAGPFLLLQPRSEQSCPWSDHWPHWERAVRWLLEETPYICVLCGHGWDAGYFGAHPRLINLVGQLPSMAHVLALAERSAGIVTTSNALSMWSVVRELPSVVALNQVLRSRDNYFRRWIDRPNHRLVEPYEPLESFIDAFRAAFG